MSKQDRSNKAVRIDGWGFEGSFAGTKGGGGVPLLGVFLIILGLFLAAGQLFKEVQLGASAFFLAVGIVLILMGLRDRSDLALYVGIFITAIALSDLLTGMNVIHGSGWGTLFMGIGVVASALLRASEGRSWTWIAVVGGLLALWGGGEAATSYTNVATDKLVGPLLIVLFGLYIIRRRSSRA